MTIWVLRFAFVLDTARYCLGIKAICTKVFIFNELKVHVHQTLVMYEGTTGVHFVFSTVTSDKIYGISRHSSLHSYTVTLLGRF